MSKDNLMSFGGWILGLVFICGLIYGMFKTVSYEIFYEDMVIETFHEEYKKINPRYKCCG